MEITKIKQQQIAETLVALYIYIYIYIYIDIFTKKLNHKLIAKKNLVLFAVQKLYIIYQNRKDGLCLKRHNSS